MPAANRLDIMCTTISLPRHFHHSVSWRTAPGIIQRVAHERLSRQHNLQQALPCQVNMFVPNAAHAKRAVQAVTHSPPEHRKKVVGLGLACWDFLAQVAAFPKPDEKLRTQRMEVKRQSVQCRFCTRSAPFYASNKACIHVLQTRGGGNCANALTAASRLGVDACLVTKVGNDSIGQQIVQELQADGVSTEFLLRSQGASHFSYMIVDKQGKGKMQCCFMQHENLSALGYNHRPTSSDVWPYLITQ